MPSIEKMHRKKRGIVYPSIRNVPDDSLQKYGSHLKKGFLTGSFHPSYERKYAEDHSNCRNRLSISHQRTLTMTETKLNEFFCA